MPNKSVHLTRGAGAPLAGKLRRYAGTLKARSALGSFALRARFPKTLRGKAAVKYWEIIIENLRNAGWNCGSISSTDDEGRQFWIVAAEREDAGRFIVQAHEKLTGLLELESAIRGSFSSTHPCTVKRHSTGTETYD